MVGPFRYNQIRWGVWPYLDYPSRTLTLSFMSSQAEKTDGAINWFNPCLVVYNIIIKGK